METFIFIMAAIGISGVIGYLIGQTRGRAGEGIGLSLVLGPIGWLLVLCGPDLRLKCPWCKGALPDAEASRCMHCGQPIEAVKEQPATVYEDREQLGRAVRVQCPACGAQTETKDLTTGVRCVECGIGFVPRPVKV